MRDPHQIILRPILTERSMWLRDVANQYTFEVPVSVNKIEIRQAITQLWPKVKITKINTIRRKGKTRRVRMALGRTKDTKRAIVTLREGDSITLE